MKKVSTALAAMLMILPITGCVMNHTDAGTITGGAVGALVGSQFGSGSGKAAAMVGGAVIGAMIGNQIGQSMDAADRMRMRRALETAPSGRDVEWTNPDSGNHYVVRPTKTYYHERQPCREYTTTAIIGGKKQNIYGKACRTADGDWRVVS